MRVVLVVLTLAVAGFLSWVARQAHITSLRAIADEDWVAPAHLWSCIGGNPTVADVPNGTPLDLDVEQRSYCDVCGFREPGPERIAASPHAREVARRALDTPTCDDWPEYVLADETRTVAGREWHRWDLRDARR